MSVQPQSATTVPEAAKVASALLIPPAIVQAQEAFRRELPQLLKERSGQWVAYHGSQRIGFAARDLDLYDECQRRGFADDEYLVLCIEPEAD